jgi:hypothetical protein
MVDSLKGDPPVDRAPMVDSASRIHPTNLRDIQIAYGVAVDVALHYANIDKEFE